jgi:hypothetical protein
MKGDDCTDEQVLFMVGQADKQLFDAGKSIQERYWSVPEAVMRKLGYVGYTIAGPGKPEIFERIEKAFASIYRPQDLAVGGHIGVFMYRDIFARIAVPHAYGKARIDLFKFVELTPVQLRIIQTEPDQVEAFVDQFCDVADIQYGTEELKPQYSNKELVGRFLGLARLHLHATAAVLTGGYDHRGAIQSSILATELALKSGAAAQGLDEQAIKDKFHHDLGGLVKFVAAAWPSFDGDRVRRAVGRQPRYVLNRYAPTQPDRREVGHLAMGAQYIVSELVRQLSDRNFRKGLQPAISRSYPP